MIGVHPVGAADLEVLWDARPDGLVEMRGGIGGGLARRYGGELFIPLRPDRPTMIANFVETLDGVVSMDAGKSGGRDVSGSSPADRFVIGLLRALADVIVIGAGTLRTSDAGPRTAGAAFPAAAPEFAELRAALGLASNPSTLVVTRGGDVDGRHRAFADSNVPAVIAGPEEAVARLRSADLPAGVRIERLSTHRPIGAEIAALAARLGARLVLSEAGPHLAAELVSAGTVDELFLTASPQLAGRDGGSHRLSLLEGVAFWPNNPRWLRLRTVRRAGDHLFLRYEFEEPGNGR
jgi:riboflavin biosynthesis pyrimidine reductase